MSTVMWAEDFAKVQISQAIARATAAEKAVQEDAVALAAVRRELHQIQKLEQEALGNISAYMRPWWPHINIQNALRCGKDALALAGMAESWIKK